MEDGLTSEFDTWRKEGGASLYNSTPITGSPKINGLWDFWNQSLVQELIAATADGNLYTVGAGGVVKTLGSGYGTDFFTTFAEGWDNTQKVLLVSNGNTTPLIYTGGATATAMASTNINLDWTGANQPTFMFQHRSRMIALGVANQAHKVYLSLSSQGTPGGHTNFQAAESLIAFIYPGEAQALTAGISWREVCYLFKYPFGIYAIDDTDPNPANWNYPRLSRMVGVPGPGCVLDVDNDVIILGSDGLFYSLTTVLNLGEFSAQPMLPTQTGIFIRESVNLNRLNRVQSAFYSHKRQAVFVVPLANSSVNNLRITLDLHRVPNLQVRLSRRDVCESIALRRGQINDVRRPIIGDDVGQVWQLDQTARSKNGVGYTGQFETAQVEFYQSVKRANLKSLDMQLQPLGQWDVTTEIHRDGQLSETIAFTQQSLGGAIGSASLDADVLGGTVIANTRHRLGGDCRWAKCVCYNKTAGQDFSIMRLTFGHKPGNER